MWRGFFDITGEQYRNMCVKWYDMQRDLHMYSNLIQKRVFIIHKYPWNC